MKKQIIYTQEFAAKFKLSYSKKMGGSQVVILPNGQKFDFNDKEYYSGRGAKYNSASMHDNIGDVIVTAKQFAAAKKIERERKAKILQAKKEQLSAEKLYNEAKEKGVYPTLQKEHGNFIQLSQSEILGKYFDSKRLAATLDIRVEDAQLLNSCGKTYVFAKTTSGKLIKLYHGSLSVNSLYISFENSSEIEFKEFVERWGERWEKYSYLVGQTDVAHHFVC